MLGLMSRFFGYVLVGTCLGSLSLVFFSVAGLFRLLPRLLHLIRLGLRGFLILSFRFYRLLLTSLAPIIQRHLNINILVGPLRVIGCLLFSLALGLLLLFLTKLPVTGWSVGFCFLHGLSVGLAWDEIETPRGLYLGVEIQ